MNSDYFASDYGKRESKQIIGLNAPRYNLLREALRVNVNEYCWCFLICSNVHVTLEALAKEFNIKEREEILEKFILAKSVWSCHKCVESQKPFEIELILSGYIWKIKNNCIPSMAIYVQLSNLYGKSKILEICHL